MKSNKKVMILYLCCIFIAVFAFAFLKAASQKAEQFTNTENTISESPETSAVSVDSKDVTEHGQDQTSPEEAPTENEDQREDDEEVLTYTSDGVELPPANLEKNNSTEQSPVSNETEPENPINNEAEQEDEPPTDSETVINHANQGIELPEVPLQRRY